MSLDGAKLRYVDESGLPVILAAKGRTFQVGSYLSCDLVLEGPQVEEVMCEIKCDAFGRVTINNKSSKQPIQLNDKVVTGKRPLLHGARITILNQVYTWEFPKISEAEDVPRTPERLSPIEQASNSCPSLKLHSHRPQIDKRLTVHNFRYCINSDDDGNTSIESRDQSDAHVEDDESQRCKTPQNAEDEPAATACQSPKVDLLDATQNKENTATPPASHKKLLKLCALSDVVITSFSPRETGVKTEKSFTCIRKPNTATVSTPKSVYSTPKSVLSELNEDSCSRDLLDFSTPSTSQKARRETSMHLIDLTTPQKLRLTLKQTPISVSDSADESSDISPLVIDITKTDTPPSPASSRQVPKTPKRLAAGATPKRTPQSLMKRALLTSTKKQIAANRVEATTPVGISKRTSLLEARRQCLTTPRRLPFHPQKRTPAQRAADQEKAKTPSTSPRKRPSLFFVSPRENKLSQMRKSLAVARRSPNVERSNKLVAKARRSLCNSPRDGSPKPGSPRIGSPRHESPKPASPINRLEVEGKALNVSKSKCSTPEKLDDSEDELSRTFTIKDDDDEECGAGPIKAGSSAVSPRPAVATDAVDPVEETRIIDDSICEEVHVDVPEKIENEGAVVIEDSICEEVPTDPTDPKAEVKESSESSETNKENEASAVKPSPVEQPNMGMEKEAAPLPRRSSRRLSADQRIVAITPRRSTRRASVEVNSEQAPIRQRTRRASFSSVDTQALATPTRKRRLTEDMGTPTRQSKRLLNTPKRANLVDESVGDMGVIVEEAAPADEEKAATEDEDYGTELAMDEPDNVDYHGLRDMLKTPKNCSTPLFKGLRELMQTPRMPASPILGNIEELLEASDSVSQTPRRSRRRGPAEDEEGADLARILKTPSAKNIMVPNEPASTVLHSRKDYTRDSVVLSTSVAHAEDTETEINVTTVSTATDADPLAASKRNDSVSSEGLMNLSEAPTYSKTATTSTTYKAAIRADLELSTLTEEGGETSRPNSPSINEISGIQRLDQTADSMFSDPPIVSAVDSAGVTVEETKVQTIRSPSVPIASDDRSDTDSINGLSEPLVFSDDEDLAPQETIAEAKKEEISGRSNEEPSEYAATDTCDTNGKEMPKSVGESIEDVTQTVQSSVDEISLIEVQDITAESSINATKPSENQEPPPQPKETDVSSVVEATIPESETYPLDSTIEYSAIELNVTSCSVGDVSSSNIRKSSATPSPTATPGVTEDAASSPRELPEEGAAEKSEVEVESSANVLPEESTTDESTQRELVEETSEKKLPIQQTPEGSVRDTDKQEKVTCEESPVKNSLDIIEQTPEANKTPADVSLVVEGTEEQDIQHVSAVVNAVKDTSEDPQMSHETAISTDDPEAVKLEAASAPKPAEEPESQASSSAETASEPATEAHNLEDDSNVVDITQEMSIAEQREEAETPPEDGKIQLDAFSIIENVDEESITDRPQEAEAAPTEESSDHVVPEESLIEEVPDESLIEDVPEESLIDEVPDESLIDDVPEKSLIEKDTEESLVEEVPDDSLIEAVPEKSLIEDVPKESLIEDVPEESIIEEAPEASLIEKDPEESLIEEVPDDSLIEAVPEKSLIEDVPKESLIEDVPEESIIEEAPEAYLIEKDPEESLIEEVPDDSLIEVVPEKSLIEDVPEESMIEETPEESLIEKDPEESLIEEVPDDSLIEIVPEKSLIEDVPEKSLIEDVPEESLMEKNPKESLIKEASKESLIENLPEESIIEEATEESLIKKDPEESLIEEVPDDSLIEAVPEKSLIEDVPEESLIEKDPKESLLEEAAKESLNEEAAKESLIENVPEESMIEEAPYESLIEEVPEDSLIEKDPEESIVNDVPEESHMEEAPEESLIENIPEKSSLEKDPEQSLKEVVPEQSLIEKNPEESLIEEAPEKSLIESIPNDYIAMETTLDEICSEDQQTNGPTQKEKYDAATTDVAGNAEANDKPAAGVEIANTETDAGKEPTNLDESAAVDLPQAISILEEQQDKEEDEVIQLDASNRLEDVSIIEEMPEPEAAPAEESANKNIKDDASTEVTKPVDTTRNESPSAGQQSNGQDVETAVEKPASSDESLIEQPEAVSLLEASKHMDIPDVVNDAERSPARENGNDEEVSVIQLDASNAFEDVEETPEAHKPPSDEAPEAETLPTEESSLQSNDKSTNDDKVIPVDASSNADTHMLDIQHSLSGNTAAVSVEEPEATATAIELPKESERMSTSDTEVVPEGNVTNKVAAVQGDSTPEEASVSETTPDETKVQEKIAVAPELDIQQKTETETEPVTKADPPVKETAEVVKELTQSSPEREEKTSETNVESSKEPCISTPTSISEESTPPAAVEETVQDPEPEKEEELAVIRPASIVVESNPPPAIEELSEPSQSSTQKEEASAGIRAESSKESISNAPISIDDESTPLSTEEIQSVSSTSESEEVIDETPTNQSLIGSNATNILENRPPITGHSASDEIQIISDDSQSESTPKDETSSQDDEDEDDEEDSVGMLEEQAEPVNLQVKRRETTTRVFPSKVQMDDVVIELSDSNSSHATQEKIPAQTATPTPVVAATAAPAVEQPSSSGAPAKVDISPTKPDPAAETKVQVAVPDDAPSTKSPTEMQYASEGAQISVEIVSETQAACGPAVGVETDFETNKSRNLATEKQHESNSENGNKTLEEKVPPETEREQEPEVEAAAKQEAKKETGLGQKDVHSPAKEEVLPAVSRRVTRKGSSVERTAAAIESERPRRRGRKPTAEEPPIIEQKEANMETVKKRGRKPSKEVDEANPEQEAAKTNLEKPKRRGRKPSAEDTKDNEATTEERPVTAKRRGRHPSSEKEMLQKPKGQEILAPTHHTEERPGTEKSHGRPPSAEKDELQKAKAQDILAPINEDQTEDSELKKPAKRGRKSAEFVQEEHKEVLPETSKRRGRPPSAEKHPTKDDAPPEHLAANKEDQPAVDEPMKPLKRTRKASERLKPEEASQPTATKEDQPDAAPAERPKRRGRKPSVDVELAAPDVLEKPRARRGQKADKEPAAKKRMASVEPVDPHLEEIPEEDEREPEPKKLMLEGEQEEHKTRRRGRKPTADTVDIPEEHVEASSSRRRGRKATEEEATDEPKPKRHSAESVPLVAPLPEIIQEAATAAKPARRGRKPSVDVDVAVAEKKLPARAVRKASASVDEGSLQTKKTTARRGHKASAQEEVVDAQPNMHTEDVPTEIVTVSALVSAEKANDGVYSSPSHTEDELTPRRREGRNIPRKNYTEVADDDKPSPGSRRNRKPVTSGKSVAPKTPDVEALPTTPTPSQKGPPIEEPAPAAPATPEINTVTLPDPTTSQRREGRNLPRKNYTEAPDDDKPTPSRSRRQRNPTVKALELIVDTTPRPATPRRRKGKAIAGETHEEAPQAAEETPAMPTAASAKGRGTRRKAEDVTEAESTEVEEAEPETKPTARKSARGNARKAKVGTEPDPAAQPATKKARGGARAKTPVVIVSDDEPEPAQEPVVTVAAKKPAARGRARAAKATPIVESLAEQDTLSPEAAGPSAPAARGGRAKKVHFEATLPVAESAPGTDEAPKRATRSRRK
ncbi:titin [Drosophila madeirensis]|uniref:Titin n=1 Tax=Drosophila madeirensis TaxID=30013 RepID=A0AAU9EV36_DROMD